MNFRTTTMPNWLDSFEVGEQRYIPITGQEEANNLVRQIQAKSRRKERTKNWKFVCTTLLTMNISSPLDQGFLLEVMALNNGELNKGFTL